MVWDEGGDGAMNRQIAMRRKGGWQSQEKMKEKVMTMQGWRIKIKSKQRQRSAWGEWKSLKVTVMSSSLKMKHITANISSNTGVDGYGGQW